MIDIFSSLTPLFESNPFRAWFIVASMVIIAGLIIWVSIIDIKYKEIEFWKLLIVGGSTIILPIIESFICGCPWLKFFLIGSLVLWFLLLFLNIKFNDDSIFGRADVDIISALLSELIAVTIWMFLKSNGSDVANIAITGLWYNALFYLLVGAITFIVCFIIFFVIQVIRKKEFIKDLRYRKTSFLPILIPVSVMVPYLIMVQ